MSVQYSGPDRRIQHRRQKSDRREDIRFEPNKKCRRSGIDRRQDIWKGRDNF